MADPNILTTDPPKTGLLAAASKPGESITGYTPTTATASNATSTGYTAKTVAVGENDTVLGQVNKITSQDSPLMRQAERRAKESMAPRGLLNSSMAVGAAQEGVIAQALPIAQQDASTYFSAQTKNADSENAALNFGANASNQASLANAQLGTDTSKFNAASKNDAGAAAALAGNQAALAKLDVDNRTELAKLDADTRTSLAEKDNATRLTLGQLDATTRLSAADLDARTRILTTQLDVNSRAVLTEIESRNKGFLQANQNAANMYNSAATAIANISIQTNLTPEAKKAAIDTQLNMLQEGLRQTGDVANLDLSSYYNPSDLVADTNANGAVTIDNMDRERYIAEHPDVVNAWLHYNTYGRYNGFQAYPLA